jgi:phosphoribosylformylglycinamidine cyclo-ligase
LNETVGATLLKEHPSYLKPLSPLLDTGKIKGLAHITGGGLTDNIPRVLPEGTSVLINRGTWPELGIFEVMKRIGNVDEAEMFRAFNMGIGMTIFCSRADAPEIASQIEASGSAVHTIGKVVEGNRDVRIE